MIEKKSETISIMRSCSQSDYYWKLYESRITRISWTGTTSFHVLLQRRAVEIENEWRIAVLLALHQISNWAPVPILLRFKAWYKKSHLSLSQARSG